MSSKERPDYCLYVIREGIPEPRVYRSLKRSDVVSYSTELMKKKNPYERIVGCIRVLGQKLLIQQWNPVLSAVEQCRKEGIEITVNHKNDKGGLYGVFATPCDDRKTR